MENLRQSNHKLCAEGLLLPGKGPSIKFCFFLKNSSSALLIIFDYVDTNERYYYGGLGWLSSLHNYNYNKDLGKREIFYTSGAIISIIIACGFSIKVVYMQYHIQQVVKSNISSDYKASYQRFIAFADSFAILTVVLMLSFIWNFIMVLCRGARTANLLRGLQRTELSK